LGNYAVSLNIFNLYQGVVFMPRIKGALVTRKRRNKVLREAKGYWGAKSKHFKMAKQAVMKSGNYAYIGRKHRKRDFRRLWITRISAACRLNGTNYSQFMHALKLKGITLNRKSLSEIAATDCEGFVSIVNSLQAPNAQ
jgi:large subunit ribosomal protein L20